MAKIRIGTRGSRLALWQAGFAETALRKAHPYLALERVVIKTEGDVDQTSSLTRIGGTGVFTKSIEDALLDGRIDIAVHSLKDLPSTMAAGLELGAVPERGAVEDALVTRGGLSLDEIPGNARIATGSIRRRSQLLHLRPDLEIRDLRGNIDTRLRKLVTQNLAGIVMARAAIERLRLEDVAYWVIPEELMIPGVGQGALGVQIRSGDAETRAIVECLNHAETNAAVEAERAFLRELDSGCLFPVGARATVRGSRIEIAGFVGSTDGVDVIRDRHVGDTNNAGDAGFRLARKFVDRGALGILGGIE
jgi:hydroxymethylbilane synthase